MKTLYLECNMGAAGDMLTAALLELHPAPEDFIERLNRLNLPNVHITAEKSVKCGITGTHVSVKVNNIEEMSEDVSADEHSHGHEHHHGHEHNHEHHHHHGHHHNHEHNSLQSIENIVAGLDVLPEVKNNIISVYKLIAEAESTVHDKPVSEIHFHEVGTMDAVADITAVCMLINELSPDKIAASPVHVGSGNVRCAHGILPVPAPAASYLLKGIPSYSSNIKGELCTPTGAALLKHFVEEFGAQPVMRIEKTGYGMGNKEFEQANCVRASMGQTDEQADRVLELSCNLDDMTPEETGYAFERLFEAGALDVFTIPVGMKKNRPGTLLTCLCREKDRETILRQIFLHTTTLGIRENICSRYTLQRSEHMIETKFGSIHIKTSSGYGVKREKAEYDDIAKIAREQGISLRDVISNG